MKKTYSKEEAEQLGKDALKGSKSAYAHVHEDGSIYLDHQDEMHEDNDTDSIKVVNEALKKAEASNEEVKELVKKALDTAKDAEAKLEAESTEHKKCKDALTSALKEIENLQAKVAELEKPVKAPEPEPAKTEEKGTKK